MEATLADNFSMKLVCYAVLIVALSTGAASTYSTNHFLLTPQGFLETTFKGSVESVSFHFPLCQVGLGARWWQWELVCSSVPMCLINHKYTIWFSNGRSHHGKPGWKFTAVFLAAVTSQQKPNWDLQLPTVLDNTRPHDLRVEGLLVEWG
jgi:hypothetical protein